MIKFWKEDFEYTNRIGIVEPFSYIFIVRGESSNYLRNKYKLDYANIFVNCDLEKNIYIGSRAKNNQRNDVCDCLEEDLEELYKLLEPIMTMDMRNYEEYICNDWYEKDDMWE